MKRILIILFLLAASVAVSAYSIRTVGEANDFVKASVVRSQDALDQGDDAALARELLALAAYWERAESSLVHLVRHTGVDDITKSIARLPALAAHKDYPELAATLAAIKRQMDQVQESEQITLSNLL